MGRLHTLSRPPAAVPARRAGAVRVADVVLGTLLLALAAPLMAVVALAVRVSSTGQVLHREPVVAGDGRRVELLSFRVLLDGGATEAHQRVRAAIGAAAAAPVTGVGRWLRRLRLDRLPRLVNVVAGHISLFP